MRNVANVINLMYINNEDISFRLFYYNVLLRIAFISLFRIAICAQNPQYHNQTQIEPKN